MSKTDKITGKKYSLTNSYFKYKKPDNPDTLLEIAQYWQKHNELPFEYQGDNWIYDTMVERQKKRGVINNQYMTPPALAKALAAFTDSFIPTDNKVLNACSGIGQITKALMDSGLNVTGFDIDPELVSVCKILYPQCTFEVRDYREKLITDEKWDLIVANPPHEINDLIAFFSWLQDSLSIDGKAILLLPVDFIKKDKPYRLRTYFNSLNFMFTEKVDKAILPPKLHDCEYVIAGLSEEKKNEIKTQSDKITINKKIMEKLDTLQNIELSRICINPLNPRKRIKDEEIKELAQAIKKMGLLQPITLRVKDGKLEIVAGERRYRAFKLNNETTIPAIIKDLTDAEAMELTLAENINRSDLSPLEEANAFKYFIDVHNYKIEDLIDKFGKNDSYIRGRLRLLLLIEEFQTLLNDEEISIGMALEISKYSTDIQQDVFKEHFNETDSSNWKSLSTKDFAGRMTRLYTMTLADYEFDKTQCQTCPFNTDTSSLFDQFKGKCTHITCLKQKKNEHTLNYCKTITDKKDIIICVSPFDKVNPEIGDKLKEEGIKVNTVAKYICPDPPRKPNRSDYSMQFKYDEAMEEYKIEELSYYADLEEYENKVETGEYKRSVYIGSNNPMPCYVPVDKSEEKDELTSLMQETEKNKTNTIKNIYNDTLSLIVNRDLPLITLSQFEEEILSFLLLDYLDRKYFKLFDISDQNATLSDQDKEKIIKNLTSQQSDILKRAFILRRITSYKHQSNNSRLLFLLPEFGKQHFPEETKEIITQHMNVYNKTHKILTGKMEKLKAQKAQSVVPELVG